MIPISISKRSEQCKSTRVYDPSGNSQECKSTTFIRKVKSLKGLESIKRKVK